jgi:hypothetical protein
LTALAPAAIMDEPASPVHEQAPAGAACVTRLPRRGLAAAWHFTAGQEQGEEVVTDASEPRVVGRVPFVDGVTRDVYEGADGRQWVKGGRAMRADKEARPTAAPSPGK